MELVNGRQAYLLTFFPRDHHCRRKNGLTGSEPARRQGLDRQRVFSVTSVDLHLTEPVSMLGVVAI